MSEMIHRGLVSLPMLACKPTAVPTAATPSLQVTINATMGTAADPGIDKLETDLLVLTATTNFVLTEGMRKIDELLCGRLSATIAQQDFRGKRGQVILIDCPTASSIKSILLVGLGDHRNFDGEVLCELFGLVLEQAYATAASKVVLPIQPNRQTGRNVSLVATAAVLRCRMGQIAIAHSERGLPAVELFCTPQAGRYLQAGLKIAPWRCQPCPLNELEPDNEGTLDVLA